MSSNTIISWRPENVIRRLPWRLDSKAALGFLLILAAFSLIGWLYLTQASAVTTTTYRIDELRLELEQINNQNVALALEIAQLESLSHLEKRALDLGLRPTDDVRYLPVPNYPVSPEKELSGYYRIEQKTEEKTGSNAPEFGASNWRLRLLDEIAAWLARK